MKLTITVGGSSREVDIETLLSHPGMERNPQEAITNQIMALFEDVLGDEWRKAQTQMNLVCDAMGWGFTE